MEHRCAYTGTHAGRLAVRRERKPPALTHIHKHNDAHSHSQVGKDTLAPMVMGTDTRNPSLMHTHTHIRIYSY